MGREGEVKVKSLQKAMEVLECFIQKQPLGVTEISEKLGLYNLFPPCASLSVHPKSFYRTWILNTG